MLTYHAHMTDSAAIAASFSYICVKPDMKRMAPQVVSGRVLVEMEIFRSSISRTDTAQLKSGSF